MQNPIQHLTTSKITGGFEWEKLYEETLHLK